MSNNALHNTLSETRMKAIESLIHGKGSLKEPFSEKTEQPFRRCASESLKGTFLRVVPVHSCVESQKIL